MAEISIDDSQDLRVIRVSDVIHVADLVDAINANYTPEVPPRFILWDLTDADAGNLTSLDLNHIAGHLAIVARDRDGGRTAILSPRDVNFGLGRMLTAYAEERRLQFEFGVFRQRDEAIAWFTESGYEPESGGQTGSAT